MFFFLELFLKEGKKGNERNYSHYNSNFIENLDNIYFFFFGIIFKR